MAFSDFIEELKETINSGGDILNTKQIKLDTVRMCVISGESDSNVVFSVFNNSFTLSRFQDNIFKISCKNGSFCYEEAEFYSNYKGEHGKVNFIRKLMYCANQITVQQMLEVFNGKDWK